MSKSELHDWECDIEKLSGYNADKMLEIAQDIYNTAFVRGRNSMTWETPTTRWIPCSERLPKKGEQVLCCNNKGSVFTSAITYVSDGGYAYFGQHFDVIAWQPLPEAYKEES